LPTWRVLAWSFGVERFACLLFPSLRRRSLLFHFLLTSRDVVDQTRTNFYVSMGSRVSRAQMQSCYVSLSYQVHLVPHIYIHMRTAHAYDISYSEYVATSDTDSPNCLVCGWHVEGPATHLSLVIIVCREYEKRTDFVGPP
jgi:hypothetical protein